MAEGGVSEDANKNVATKDTSRVESVEMLNELADDYAEYLQINRLKEVLGFYAKIVVVLVLFIM